jgi:RNase H-like domain found in reverse transcriptase/Reverse transcriptase (RNA-dependent DNA polymerase)/Integrase zinc binding domain/Integrase core domain
VTGEIEGVVGQIIIDTGAQVSLLSKGVSANKLKELSIKVKGINGGLLKIYGSQTVNLTLGSCNIATDMLVCDLPPKYLAVVGLDLLSEWRAIVDLPHGILKLKFCDIMFSKADGENVTCTKGVATRTAKLNSRNDDMCEYQTVKDGVINRSELCSNSLSQQCELNKVSELGDDPYGYSCYQVIVPPRSQKLVTLKIGKSRNSAVSSNLEGVDLLLEPEELCIHGIHCARTVGRVSNKLLLTKVVNVSQEEIVIPKSIRLVKLEKLEVDKPDVDVVGKEWASKSCFSSTTVDTRNIEELLEKKLEHLDASDRQLMLSVLMKYDRLYYKEGDKRLRCTSAVKHIIHTGDSKPIYKRAYRVPQSQRELVKKLVEDQLEKGIIEPSSSPYGAPVVIVPKKSLNGEKNYRFCVDFRLLNAKTIPDVYSLPNITETLESFCNCNFFSTIDLASGYYQIPMDKDSAEKTAFNVPGGHYQYTRMAMGLRNSAATFQRLMDSVLMNLSGEEALCYIDDVVIFSKDIQSHVNSIDKVFKRLNDVNLTIRLEKCTFAASEVNYLGHVISSRGLFPDPKKVEAIKNYLVPKSATEVRSFIGLAGYYRRFIFNFADVAKPLTLLTRQDVKFHWSEECQDAFDKLRNYLAGDVMLSFPDFDKEFVLSTDASGVAISAILAQEVDGHQRPIAYASRQLNEHEKNYGITKLEMLAVVWATKFFRCYLYGRRFKVITDHKALLWLDSVKDTSSMLMRWALRLSEFDYVVEHKPGKKHSNADALSRHVAVVNKVPSHLPVIDLDIIRECQKVDTVCQNLRKRKDIKMSREKVLYHERDEDKLIVIPQKLKQRILYLHHDLPAVGHAGVSKTLARLKYKFWWPKMLEDVKGYVRSCRECSQRSNIGREKAPLGKFEEPNSPFSVLATDIVGPMPKTESNNRYVLSVIDHYSRFVTFVALPDQTAQSVAGALVGRVFTLFGIPKVLISDQGSSFTSELMKQVCQLLRIKKVQTTSYHAMANGRCERVHRTLSNMLSHYVNKNQNDWDELLPFASMAINSQVNDSIGCSPFEMLFACKMEMPLDSDLELRDDSVRYSNAVENLREKLKEVRELASINQVKSREKQKKNYDKKTKLRAYSVGEFVWLHVPQIAKHRVKKLSRLWKGPYKIVAVKSNLNVKLKIRGRIVTVHVNRLKPYIEREVDAVICSSEGGVLN